MLLCPQQQKRHIADHYDIVNFATGEPILGLLETSAQPLQRDEPLVGFGLEDRRRSQLPPDAVPVDDRNAAAFLAYREDRPVGLLTEPLGGPESGTSLVRRQCRVGNKMHVGTDDVLGVVVENDAAVHLGEFCKALGRELGGIEEEAA